MEPIPTPRFPPIDTLEAPARRLSRWSPRLIFLALALPALSPAAAQAPIEYRVSFDNRAHHEARIEIRLTELESAPLEIRMSRASPGRYRLHEFVRNVYGACARDSAGQPLALEQHDAHGWTIAGHDGTVVFSYTLFGDMISGTYNSIDDYQAHLNPPASFAWARGLEDRPIQVVFDLPDGWQVATQLAANEQENRFSAPELEYFLDSPIGLGPFEWITWQSATRQGADPGSSTDPADQTFRLALQPVPGEVPAERQRDDAQQFADWAARVTREQAAIFGEFPEFDFGTYTFIAKYLPWGDGDAMEHRNSTILSNNGGLAGAELPLIHTLSHEFFHVWNVERIRPESLQPFDFENAAFTDLLWFSEGFTNYYDKLTLVRAGVFDQERFLSMVGSNLEAFRASPAPDFGGPIAMSRRAAFFDRGYWRDRLNGANTFFHYYTYGETVALALDLELRRDHDSSLDQLMRQMWLDFGKNEKPFGVDDLERTLGGLSSPDFARSFFERFVRGSLRPDWSQLLPVVGLELVAEHPDSGWIGSVALSQRADGLELNGPTRRGEPLYDAGLDRGDILIELDGKKVDTVERLDRILDRERLIGHSVDLVYKTRSGIKTGTIEIAPDPRRALVPVETTGKTLAREPGEARAAWLASRVED